MRELALPHLFGPLQARIEELPRRGILQGDVVPFSQHARGVQLHPLQQVGLRALMFLPLTHEQTESLATLQNIACGVDRLT